MRRAVLFVLLVQSLAALSLAQQVVVREPNGAERLKKGDYREIKWGCTNCTGTAELHLVRTAVPKTAMVARTTTTAPAAAMTDYQTLGVIKASIAISPGTLYYSYNWRVGDYVGGTASAGDGYKILVKVVMAGGTVTDVSDSGFVIGAPPAIDYFGINDGLDFTDQRRVTLNFRSSGAFAPSTYRVRCTPTPGTLGAWTALAAGTWPTYELPQQHGTYTIELWLANEFGWLQSRTDTVRYGVTPPPETQDYTILAASIGCKGSPDLNPGWYSCLCTSYSVVQPTASDCFCTDTGAVVVKTKAISPGVGTKVEYEFFGGRQLNPGWSFVSMSYSDAACRDHAGSAVLIMPRPGSADIKFKVRLWTEGGLWMPTTCEFRINNLVIRGPAGRSVGEAFR